MSDFRLSIFRLTACASVAYTGVAFPPFSTPYGIVCAFVTQSSCTGFVPAFPSFQLSSVVTEQVHIHSAFQFNILMMKRILYLFGALIYLGSALVPAVLVWRGIVQYEINVPGRFRVTSPGDIIGLGVSVIVWLSFFVIGCYFLWSALKPASSRSKNQMLHTKQESRWFRAGRTSRQIFERGRAMFTKKLWWVLAFGVIFFLASRCNAPQTPFRIIAGSGHSSFEEILKRFGQQNNVDIQITYKGSLDIMQMLETGKLDYDAIWDGDSLWTTMGDTQHLIKNRESIMRSPIVFGVKKPLADKLGWTGREVSVQEILQGIEQENMRVMMTSATQSNSGASAYLGFLYAFANPQGALTAEDLNKPEVRAAMKKLLGTIDRTSESSGYLRDLFATAYDSFDAMFNYESHIMELNKKLVQSNREPLYLVYPSPGLGIADFPLSYVDHGDAQKQKTFDALQKYLLSDSVQQEIAAKCRRVGKVGVDQVDANCFVSAWGADAARGTTPMRMPDTAVVWQALNLYQTALRKPSFTIYALDFSGSMSGEGEKQLKQAMSILLNQDKTSQYLLQASPDDVTMVIFFNNQTTGSGDLQNYAVTGNKPEDLDKLLSKIETQQTGGGTNIYQPVALALEYMKRKEIGDRLPAVILMTDGQSNEGNIEQIKSAISSTGLENVPVYGITFGDADDQLKVQKTRMRKLSAEGHDPSNRLRAIELAQTYGTDLYTGVFYRNPNPPQTYDNFIRQRQQALQAKPVAA